MLDVDLLSGMVEFEKNFDCDFFWVFVSFCHFLFFDFVLVLTGWFFDV